MNAGVNGGRDYTNYVQHTGINIPIVDDQDKTPIENFIVNIFQASCKKCKCFGVNGPDSNMLNQIVLLHNRFKLLNQLSSLLNKVSNFAPMNIQQFKYPLSAQSNPDKWNQKNNQKLDGIKKQIINCYHTLSLGAKEEIREQAWTTLGNLKDAIKIDRIVNEYFPLMTSDTPIHSNSLNQAPAPAALGKRSPRDELLNNDFTKRFRSEPLSGIFFKALLEEQFFLNPAFIIRELHNVSRFILIGNTLYLRSPHDRNIHTLNVSTNILSHFAAFEQGITRSDVKSEFFVSNNGDFLATTYEWDLTIYNRVKLDCGSIMYKQIYTHSCSDFCSAGVFLKLGIYDVFVVADIKSRVKIFSSDNKGISWQLQSEFPLSNSNGKIFDMKYLVTETGSFLFIPIQRDIATFHLDPDLRLSFKKKMYVGSKRASQISISSNHMAVIHEDTVKVNSLLLLKEQEEPNSEDAQWGRLDNTKEIFSTNFKDLEVIKLVEEGDATYLIVGYGTDLEIIDLADHNRRVRIRLSGQVTGVAYSVETQVIYVNLQAKDRLWIQTITLPEA